MCILLCRANVTLTDLDEFVPLISTNIDLNRRVLSGTATARELHWYVHRLLAIIYYDYDRINYYRGQDLSEFVPRPDVILMSDVVYYEEVNLID